MGFVVAFERGQDSGMTAAPRTFLFLSGRAHRALDPEARRASGGAELQVALLALELVRRGHRVSIAAADDGFTDGVEWKGVRIRACGRFDTGGLGDTANALPAVWRVLREEKPDFVVIYGWTSWLALMCLLRGACGFRVVFICALDGEIDGRFLRENPVRGRIFSWGMKAADARFGITESQAANFRKAGMQCGVTRLLLQQGPVISVADKDVDLLWVARCHQVKRPDLFLDLAERLPEARCRMICSPQDPVLWEATRARACQMPGVEFLDGVPYREIQKHFDSAKVFVNTSSDEGVPNTFLHSGLGGTAIASLSADPDGMLQRFGAGFSAGGDFDHLVQGIQKLLGDPSSLDVASSGARQFVIQWHDNARNSEAFLEGLPS